MVTVLFGAPEFDPWASIFFTKSAPSRTFPNTTCLPSNQGVLTVVMKNWDPLVLGPRKENSDASSKNETEWQTRFTSESHDEILHNLNSHFSMKVKWNAFQNSAKHLEALTSICHTQVHRSFVLQFEVFVVKFTTINTFLDWLAFCVLNKSFEHWIGKFQII